MIILTLHLKRDANIPSKGTITVSNTAAAGVVVNNTNKKVISKDCASFTDCITEVNHTQVDDAQKINIVMSMHNSIEYSDFYSIIHNLNKHWKTKNEKYTANKKLLRIKKIKKIG